MEIIQRSEILKTDKNLYWKVRQFVSVMLGVKGDMAILYIILGVFLHLKMNVEYSELLKEIAKTAGKQRQTVVAVIRNAIKNAQKNAAPGLLAEVVKEKDESTPIDFLIDIIDFIQDFDLKEEMDDDGVHHTYYQSKSDSRIIRTLN